MSNLQKGRVVGMVYAKKSLTASVAKPQTVATGGTSDHSKLYNRDLPDQHTIGAISGLAEVLANKYSLNNPPPYPVQSVNGQTGAVVLDAEIVGALPADTQIPTVPENVSAFNNDMGYLTEFTEEDPTVPAWAKQPQRPSYSTTDIGIPLVVNERQYSAQNPPPYPVASVNGKTGAVVLDAEGVGALPNTTVIPSKLSEMSGDSTHRTVTDAERAAWNAKSDFSGNYNDLTNKPTIPTVPVQSVNGKTGAVVLGAEDVSARPSTWMPTAAEVKADPAGTATAVLAGHNTSEEAHGDMREDIAEIMARLNAFFDSDDTTLDELSEIVAYIKSNKSLIESVTSSKVSVADIVNNLTTNVTNKPLSAAQGVALKALIDAITVPTKVSELDNDAGYITGYTETDPTVPAWAKQASKPTYNNSEVGLGNVANERQYSAQNPPPYPVTSVNGKTGVVSLSAADVSALPASTSIPSKLSELGGDSTHRTVTDAEKIAWNAKSEFSGSYNDLTNKPTIPTTAADVGAVPTSRTINGKALSSNITLSASDVNARPSTWTPSAADVKAVPTSRTINGKALSSNIALSASDVSAVPTSSALTVTGVDADGNTHTWTMYGVKN